MRDVLPALEQKMLADFPDRLSDWCVAVEMQHAKEDAWKSEVRVAEKQGKSPPLPPKTQHGPEPQAPRLRQNDVTIEKIADLLSTAAPKGVVVVRDELSGWVAGMNAYNDGGRAFWIEAYGGRPYRVERKKHPEPIVIPRLAVAVYGGTQPDKIAILMRDADDGLLARILWGWPDSLPFRLGHASPRTEWAIRALDRLRELDLHHNETERPIMVPLTQAAVARLEEFGREMQDRQEVAGGLLRSAYRKARGHALRLALVLELLWWCAEDGSAEPPKEISLKAFTAAANVYADYFAPMAERVYGDAALSALDRNAATLARWIYRERPSEVHVRTVQRNAKLSGLNKAEAIHAAAAILIEADWLLKPVDSSPAPGRPREAYIVNPRLWEAR